MRFIKVFAAIAITFSTLFAAGENPSPLGLEIGKATIADAKAKYRLESKGINRYSESEWFEVDISSIEMDNVKKATMIFDENGTLALVGIKFSGDRFDSLYKSLSEQYALQSDEALGGDKFVEFSAGNSKIRLMKPQGFDTSLVYGATWLWNRVENKAQQEDAKKKTEEPQL